MSYTQRFVQLTDFILLEYRYTSPIAPDYLNYSFTRVVNNHMDGLVQLMNQDNAIDVTGNVRERAAVQNSTGKFTDTDKDQVPDWLTYDQSLGGLSYTTVNGSNVPYDSLRFHIVSGYNFEDKDGIVAQVIAKERSGKDMQLANIVFLKDSDFFAFNARPIWLGDRLYDRYFECKVPSIKLNNEIFYSLEGNPAQALTFVARITSDGLGFLRAAPLTIKITDIASTSTLMVGGARYNQYGLSTTKSVALNQSDEFALLSAVIQPSPAGDYFEYFASWAGGFIEDFLLNANNLPGNNYIVLHEIRVFEQQGSLYKQTDVLQMIQEDGFDGPKKFRPTLDNADRDVSFTLEYTTKLYNKADSSQIIRTANYTSFNPKEWGKHIQKLNLLNDPEPFIIYNKVVDGPKMANESFIQTYTNEVLPFNTKYVPSFFDRFMVNIHHDTVILDKDGKLVADKTSTTTLVYGQGDCNIIINPFDNFTKFTILNVNGTETPTPLDLGSNAMYYLVFIDNNNKKVRFAATMDPILADPTKGDVLFKIPEVDAEKITTFTTKEFYIVSKFQDGNETLIYQGVFNKPQDIQTVKTTNENIKTAQNATIETKINEIVLKQEEVIATTNAIKNSAPTEQATIINAQVEIPGMNIAVPQDNMTSIVSNIVPVSIKKKSAATLATDQKLKAQADQNQASI